MSFEHIDDSDLAVNIVQSDGLVTVICDEVDGDLHCYFSVDMYINPEMYEDDGAYWNQKAREGLRLLGWNPTPDHDYCPQHANRSVKATDHGVEGSEDGLPVAAPPVAAPAPVAESKPKQSFIEVMNATTTAVNSLRVKFKW